MDDNFILEGIRIVFLIIIGIGIISGIIFIFKRFEIDQIFYGFLKKKENSANLKRAYKGFTSTEEISNLKNYMNDLENRIEKLEKIIESIIVLGQKQENVKTGISQDIIYKHESSLLSNFLTEMVRFLETYKKSRLKVELKRIMAEQEETSKEAYIPTTSTSSNEKEYKLINDINLINWWKKNAHNRLLVCRESLKEEFGKVYVEVIEGQGDKWSLIGVSSDEINFYILPRRGGWENQIYQDWFTVEEGTVRPGELIRTLKSPLPRARKTSFGWQLIGRKGKVSIE